MKLNIFLFFLFTGNFYAQTFQGHVIDKNTNQAIDMATIFFKESKYTLFSDNKGEFLIHSNAENSNEVFLISSIGYEDLEVKLEDYKKNKENKVLFLLVPKSEQLNEVIISNEKIDYSWAKTIFSKRNPQQAFSFQFGTENVRFIQNPYFKNGKIKKVILSLDKTKKDPKYPKWEIDYITAYNIKFYRYDAKNQKPGDELYNKNIIVEPGNKTQDFVINIDSLNISFPKEGVCVGVEYVNTRYVNPKKVFATIAPGMNFYEEEKLKPVISWTRYRGEDWEFKSSISNFKNRRYQNVLVVDLVVNTEK